MIIIIANENKAIQKSACLTVNIPFLREGTPIDWKFIPKNPVIKVNGKKIVATKVKILFEKKFKYLLWWSKNLI